MPRQPKKRVTKASRGRSGPRSASFETVRKLALALPGVEESTSYGTPAFRVGGKSFARLREDGESLVAKMDFEEREFLMEAEPRIFYITDHYRDYPYVLVRLAAVSPAMLRDVLEQAWRRSAPKRLVAEREDGSQKSKMGR